MPEQILEKIKWFDANANGIDLQEFEIGIKNMKEADYKALAEDLKQKDKEILHLIDSSLDKAKQAYDFNKNMDLRIINLLKLAWKITISETQDYETIWEHPEVLQATLGSAKEMLINFFQALETTMVKGESDYTFYKTLRNKTQTFLQSHPSNNCTTYADYQSQMYQIANFFNGNIKNNGTWGFTNPAYKYVREHVSFPTVGTQVFIDLWNTFNKLAQAKTLSDIENMKWEAYANTREMLGKSLYGSANKGYLWTFNTSENMSKLQEDIIDSEEMKKYLDLKIVSESLKDFKKESQNTKQMLGLQERYQKLINALNGKVPTKFILFRQQKFDNQKEEIQKDIAEVYSKESVDALQSMAIMKTLGNHRKDMSPKLTQEELVLAAEEYKKTWKFTASVMTTLEMGGVWPTQIHAEIEKTASEMRVQQYNAMLYERLSNFALENSLGTRSARADAFSKNNRLFAVYADVTGMGAEWGASDASIQKRKNMSEQILINIAITAFSGGVGSLAARAALGAVEAATIGWEATLFAARMIVEWTVFHGVNTITTWVISWDMTTMLDELKNPKAWAQSVLYMWVMNKVGALFAKGMVPGMKSMEKAAALQKLVDPGKLMNVLSKWMQFSGELAWMQATDQIVSLTFDQKFKDVSTESVMQTITLVAGLKLAHKLMPIVPEQWAITSDEVNIIDMTKTDGVVTDIKYTQKVMNTIDAKIGYLAKIMKIKSSARGKIVDNVLNDMLSKLKQNPENFQIQSQFKKLEKTLQDLKKEGKINDKIEKKFQEVSKMMEINKPQGVVDYLEHIKITESWTMKDIKADFIDKIKTISPEFDFNVLDFLVVDKDNETAYKKFYADYECTIGSAQYSQLLKNIVDIISMDKNFDFSEFGKIEHTKRSNLSKIFKTILKEKPDFDFSIFRKNPKLLTDKTIFPTQPLGLLDSKLWSLLRLEKKGIIDTEQFNQIMHTIGTQKNSFQDWKNATTSDRFKRQALVERFKDYRKTVQEMIAYLPDQIMEYFDQNPAATVKDAIKENYPLMQDLDGLLQMQIIEKITLYKQKIDTIEKYINMPEYTTAPAKLLCDMRGLKYEVVSDPQKITMRREWANIVFVVPNELDYIKIEHIQEDILIQNNQYRDSKWNTFQRSGWFAHEYSKIRGLEWTLNVVNGAGITPKQKRNTIVHENRHTLNKYLFTEKDREPLVRAKDEILAYLKDGSSTKDIAKNLLEKWWLYDYYADLKIDTPPTSEMEYALTRNKDNSNEEYEKTWEVYGAALSKSIAIAAKFKRTGIDNYLDLLAITPIQQRGRLEKTYISEIKLKDLEKEKIMLQDRLDSMEKLLVSYQNNTFQKDRNIILKEGETSDEYRERDRAKRMPQFSDRITQFKTRLTEIDQEADAIQNGWPKTSEGEKLAEHMEIILEWQMDEVLPSADIPQKIWMLALLKKYVDKVHIPLKIATELAVKFANNFKDFVIQLKWLFVQFPKIGAEITAVAVESAENAESYIKLHKKIVNVENINDNIKNITYNKENKPTQKFNLEESTPLDFLKNPDLLEEFYIKKILPEMRETDNIKIKIIQDIVDLIGWEIKNAKLKWEDNPSRAIQKILWEYDWDPNKLLDISRWSLIYHNIEQVYQSFNEVLKHPDVVSVFIKDNFQRKTWYKDINLVVMTKTGNSFELQINTENLLKSKEKWLQIPENFIQERMKEITIDPSKNFYWDIVGKLYNNEKVFDDIDFQITNKINKRLEENAKKVEKKYIGILLPKNWEDINWHKMYELSRTLEDIIKVEKNPYKEVPDRLEWSTYDEIDNYYKKISEYSNLLYDYAYSISK